MEGRMKFLVLNGPNLNLLGEREPGIYGHTSLGELEDLCREWGAGRDVEVTCAQSNSEGVLIDLLHAARRETAGVVLNAGGYTHTSIALRDAVAALDIPVVEVHLTNTSKREEFRRHSFLTPVAAGLIMGFGPAGYLLALEGLLGISAGKSSLG